jgi:hypothetical protein
MRADSETEKRTRVIAVRVNDEEYSELREQAESAGIPQLGRWVRRRLLLLGAVEEKVSRTRVDLSPLSEVQADLARVGNNLNQLARVANTTGLPDHGELDSAIREVRDLTIRIEDRIEGLS